MLKAQAECEVYIVHVEFLVKVAVVFIIAAIVFLSTSQLILQCHFKTSKRVAQGRGHEGTMLGAVESRMTERAAHLEVDKRCTIGTAHVIATLNKPWHVNIVNVATIVRGTRTDT